MSGLYTRNNLSETGLNAVDAVQKLYDTQVQQDLLLFGFSSALESPASSPDQIFALLNQSISDLEGNISLRTKFLTNNLTFSDDNKIWIDRFLDSLDKRAIGDPGSSIIWAKNSSLTRVVLESAGERYVVRNQDGQDLALPQTVQARLRGTESNSDSGLVTLTVNSDGTISPDVTISNAGSGYMPEEVLDIVLSCGEGETPSAGKCANYSGNSIYQKRFESGTVSSKASLKNSRYLYTVKFSDSDGFFLFNELESKWVYLGNFYLNLVPVGAGITFKRRDTLSSQNFTQLYKLNARSQFFSYEESYQSGSSINFNIRSLLEKAEELRNTFEIFPQNNKPGTEQNDLINLLGSSYNVIEGKNLTSNYRIIFRDPDSVLEDIDFDSLTDSTTTEGSNIPGIWVFSGTRYERVFSTDDKPYQYNVGRKFISPAIYDPDTLEELPSTGSLKYSISSSYSPLGGTVIRGFNTRVNTLIQNISTSTGNGGFVYHRTLPIEAVPGGTISKWPLLSYIENNQVKEAKILAL
jgi:hypothetical protein